MIKYRWYLKDPNAKFSNRLPPQPTLQDTMDEMIGAHVTGIWLRKVAGDWFTIIAWTNGGEDWCHNPEYGILSNDGILLGPMWSDWAFRLVHGFSRYETKRYSLGTDWRAIYGTTGK
jgi:hypothetical protein